MAFVFGVNRDFEITGILNGDPCIIPKDPRNHGFVEAFGFRYGVIARDEQRYLAFPFLVKHGSYLVAVYSNSDSHASGTSQILVVSDDGGKSWQQSLFYDKDTGNFDTALLDAVLAEGEAITLKVFTAKKEGGVISVTTASTVDVGADTYALWSVPREIGGALYRTGYKVPLSGGSKVGLFESVDNGQSWAFVSVIAESGTLLFSEADIVEVSTGNWLAVIREDSGPNDNLYRAESADAGQTWGSATVMTGVSGRQPNLIKLAGGNLVLSAGRRSGTSGFTTDGLQLPYSGPTTGVQVHQSADGGASWSAGVRLCPMWSTDGGQPMTQEVEPGRLVTLFYVNRKRGGQPVIGKAIYNAVGV